MGGRHKKKAKYSLTPLGYLALLLIIVLTVAIIFAVTKKDKSEDSVLLPSDVSGAAEPKDTTPPVIEGTKDITVYEGDTVSYRKGVTVTDDTDKNVTLDIDSKAVDLTTPGTYEATYIATDTAGNKTEATIKVTVNKKPADYVSTDTIYAAVDKKLDTLIKDGMSTRDKAKAIYNWAKWNIPYTSHSDKSDYMMEAYRVLKGNSTDCFGYFAVTKLMFERLGIPNIDVTKVKNYDGDSNHYWSLISLDDGQTYYHFDATPRRAGGDFFMLTDAELDEYSNAHKKCHNRDKSLYPATPEVSYAEK